MGGGKLTDHDIYKLERTFSYLPVDESHPERQQERQQEIGTMRLQTYTNLNTKNHAALARITVNSWTFAARSNPTNDPRPKFDMVFILESRLENGNSITLDESNEPVIHITRSSDRDNSRKRAAMAAMINNTMKAVAKTLQVRFDDPDFLPEFVPPLKLGIWAHEVGSLPMPGVDADRPSVLDANLTLRNYKGVSVCDNSVFPFSPSANPSLTLFRLGSQVICLSVAIGPPSNRRMELPRQMRVLATPLVFFYLLLSVIFFTSAVFCLPPSVVCYPNHAILFFVVVSSKYIIYIPLL